MDQVINDIGIHQTSTDEQQAIVASTGDLRIQSFAGTGKTTTYLMVARKNPGKRILYACFNRSNRLGFEKRCRQENLRNVQVETLHSLAKKAIYRNRSVDLSGTYSYLMLREMFSERLQKLDDEERSVILYSSMRLITSFCNSTQKKIQSFDFLPEVSPEQRFFVNHHYTEILEIAIDLMRMMHERKIPILHDYYLKLFQLQKQKLPFDIVLLDEVQDCTAAMVDIILSQTCKKLLAGDEHQQIYSWKGAKNSFKMIPYEEYSLSRSFRLGPSVAGQANKVLEWKEKLFPGFKLSKKISGDGPARNVKGKAILARSIIGLLKRSFAMIMEDKDALFKFQGGIDSYLRSDHGVTLMDVFNLYYEDTENIKSDFARSFHNFESLKSFAEITDDYVIKGFTELVENFQKDIPFLVRRLYEICELGSAQDDVLIFSTAHRSKGLEYEEVELEDDFLSFEDLSRIVKSGNLSTEEIIEEINVLYVALTRASGTLIFSEALIR